jgi:LysM repeat protein
MIKKYSYIILLGIMAMVFMTVAMIKTVNENEEYVKVVVSEGDTLWGIAQEYGEPHKNYSKEFINWVVSENNLIDQEIKIGQELVIPVKNNNHLENNEYVLSK